MTRISGLQAKKVLMLMLITGLVLLGAIPLDVILPSFPHLARHFHTNIQTVTYAISVFTISFALSQLLVGPLSDRIGIKKVIVGSLVIAIIGGWIATISTNYATFLFARIIQALGCSCFALTQAILQDEYKDGARVKMRIYATTSSGVFISCAPLMGSYLQETVGWQGSFWFFNAIAIVVLVLTVVSYREMTARSRRGAGFYLSTYSQMLRDRKFMGYWMITALAFSCHFAFIIASPLIFINGMHMSLRSYSLTLLTYGAAYVSGGLVATRLAKKTDTQVLLRVGTTIIGFAGILLIPGAIGLSQSPYSVLVPMLFAIVGTTMTVPAATTEAMSVFGKTAGTASSAGNLIRILVGGLISTIVSTVGKSIPLNITFLLFFSCVANFGILQIIRRRTANVATLELTEN
ncbi:MFS transporter, DHA1 family, bicyclomycin/chloramphenicol resistance protein [Paraburkholderia steynii]|uniref:MFS transporter, DHA1 family, bicyclomycin/chloramphenicol resistance protein n=1 Tax=Paraburkholderia steynii TaxID=1245441 RepID=A0A7Z7BKP4_9BURK|nr:MFS transporter [Paraburkholderia steynii]SDJ47416.1 MFS transporter, DHA1 family, bicyclomycin/chloramphenicol resistance protein [Paraburkholderia steynii]